MAQQLQLRRESTQKLADRSERLVHCFCRSGQSGWGCALVLLHFYWSDVWMRKI
jgi:hypothetical protein